jgi:hypothetical protein
VKKNVLEAGLIGIVRNYETIALASVEPLNDATDAHLFFVRVDTLELVTSHPAPLPALPEP